MKVFNLFLKLIGKNCLIRTVKFTCTGRLVAVTDKGLVIEEFEWIADTSGFHESVKDFSYEIDPFDDSKATLGLGGIIDASVIDGALPRTQK